MTDGRTKKYSVTIPEDVAASIRDRVGSGGFSAYVTAAIKRQVERDKIAEIISDFERESGPLSPGAVDEARAVLRGELDQADMREQ
jgi:hypothetical protein